MKNIFILFLLFLVVATASGCETVRGMGQDLENTGGNIVDSINDIGQEEAE
ncbi:MAG: entericidin, EcnA/B family [Candidatus Omnitrophota bacterium]